MLFQDRFADFLIVPNSEIRELKRQLGQTRFFAVKIRLVKRGYFVAKNADGPAIRNNMMDGQQQHVIVVSKTQQEDTNERPDRQIEPARTFLNCEPFLSRV